MADNPSDTYVSEPMTILYLSQTNNENSIDHEDNEDDMNHLFDYPSWGLAENTDSQANRIMEQVTLEQINAATLILAAHINLSDYEFKYAGFVKHYQGNESPSLSLIWLRFEKANGENTGILGEHVSATIDIHNNIIIGLTRMQKSLSGDSFVTHQQALIKAINFLKIAAPDLMSEDVSIPDISNSTPGSRVNFTSGLKLGNVEVHWIDDHKEEIVADGDMAEVHGMKVKMHIPSNNLWAWVIVDKNGDIGTFERNIFWNFSEFKRETQMWLHDKWLAAHNIALSKQLSPMEGSDTATINKLPTIRLV